jgi:hypothetical protein
MILVSAVLINIDSFTLADAFGVIGLKKKKYFEFFSMLPTGIISQEVKEV